MSQAIVRTQGKEDELVEPPELVAARKRLAESSSGTSSGECPGEGKILSSSLF